MSLKARIRGQAIILALGFGLLVVIFGFKADTWQFRFEIALFCFIMWLLTLAVIAGILFLFRNHLDELDELSKWDD